MVELLVPKDLVLYSILSILFTRLESRYYVGDYSLKGNGLTWISMLIWRAFFSWLGCQCDFNAGWTLCLLEMVYFQFCFYLTVYLESFQDLLRYFQLLECASYEIYHMFQDSMELIIFLGLHIIHKCYLWQHLIVLK